MNRSPLVYCVVLNWMEWEDSVECVRSLQRSTYAPLSIVIVDNSSPNDSADQLERVFPDLPVLRSPRNGGYAAGNNIGIRYALEQSAEYVFIINNDATVEPDCIESLVAHAEQNPETGILNGRVYYPGSTEIFSAAGRINPLLCTGQNKGSLHPTEKDLREVKDVDYVCGVMMLVRSQLFRTVGLLEERFFMYFEDLEFSLRVAPHFVMRYIPGAVAYHKSGGGKGWRNYTELYLYYHTRNRFLVYHDAPAVYRMYVAVFSTLNIIGKTLFLVADLPRDASSSVRRVRSAWKGWKDGMKGIVRK